MKIEINKKLEGEPTYNKVELDLDEYLLISEYHSGIWSDQKDIDIILDKLSTYNFNISDVYDFQTYKIIY